jgi:hypothetical protein
MKILPLLFSTIFSYVGWELGEPLGFFWSFGISGVAALVGVYLGWKTASHFGL